jgi:hypothetical protein
VGAIVVLVTVAGNAIPAENFQMSWSSNFDGGISRVAGSFVTTRSAGFLGGRELLIEVMEDDVVLKKIMAHVTRTK